MYVRAGEQTQRAMITMPAMTCMQTVFLRDGRKVLYRKLVENGKGSQDSKSSEL